jgi:hypothetical protein
MVTDENSRRGSYVAPGRDTTKAERRRKRRRDRRIARDYHPESPLVTRLKQVALVLFLVAGAAFFFYAFFIYE